MLRKLSWLLFACGMGFGSAQAAVLQVSASGELTGAVGVNVDGTLFDVQFVEGTCAALFSECDDEDDFTFTTLDTAIEASQALLDQVFLNLSGGPQFDTQPELTLGCESLTECFAQTPFSPFVGNVVNVAAAANFSIEAADLTTNYLWPIEADTTLTAEVVFAVWTLSDDGPGTPAPAPGVLSLLVLGLLNLGWSRFRST